jgi:hypothetical protein
MTNLNKYLISVAILVLFISCSLKWYKKGFTNPEIEKCKEYDFDVEEAALWKSFNIDCKTAHEWKINNFEVEYASDCIENNFSVTDAKKWREVHLTCSSARLWKENKFTIEEAYAWSKIGVQLNDAIKLREIKVTPEQYQYCKKFNVTSIEDFEWLKEGFYCSEIKGWKDLGLKLSSAIIWMREGFTPETAKPWLSIHYNPKDAKKLQKNSVNPEEAKLYSENGINPDCIIYWKNCGVGLEILDWAKAGFKICSGFDCDQYKRYKDKPPNKIYKIYEHQIGNLRKDKKYQQALNKYKNFCAVVVNTPKKVTCYEVYGEVKSYDENEDILLLEGGAFNLNKKLYYLKNSCIVVKDYSRTSIMDHMSFMRSNTHWSEIFDWDDLKYDYLNLIKKRFYYGISTFLGKKFVPNRLETCYFFLNSKTFLKTAKCEEIKQKHLNEIYKFGTKEFPDLPKEDLQQFSCDCYVDVCEKYKY